MGEQPEEETSNLFDGVETAEGLESSREGIDMTPEDRPRGILSPTDRDYLCGLKEYAQPQTDANRRQDIRERVVNGLKDFALLSLYLEKEEREKIVEELGQDETEQTISSMAAFAYLALEQDQPRFEECLERGILMAAKRDKLFRSAGRATDADVSINVEYNPDPEKLYRKFEQGKDLTDADIGVLVRSGKLDAQDVENLQNEPGGFRGVFPAGR